MEEDALESVADVAAAGLAVVGMMTVAQTAVGWAEKLREDRKQKEEEADKCPCL